LLSRRPLHPLRALRARLLPAVRPLLRRPAPWRVVLSQRPGSALRRRSRVLGQAGARPDPFHRSGRRQLRRSAPAVRHSLLTARYRRREMFTAASAKLLVAALLTAGCALARAADLYVICNAHVSLSPADVRDLFLGEAQFLGALEHPEVSMHTHSFAAYMRCIDSADWPGVGELMLASAHKLARAGADFLICPDNTIHQALPWVVRRSPLPWLHIAEEVAAQAAARGFHRLGIIGTRYLVDSEVYPEKLTARSIGYLRPN